MGMFNTLTSGVNPRPFQSLAVGHGKTLKYDFTSRNGLVSEAAPRFFDRPARIILTGGGTSGHVHPALAMGQAFERLLGGADIRYVGVRGRAEEVIVPRAGLPLAFVPAAPYASPRRPKAFARFAFNLGLGCLKAAGMLMAFRPDFILATGGYVAAPMVLSHMALKALGLSRAKVILHEANAVPGKLNHLMASRADHLFLTFAGSQEVVNNRRCRVVGYPVRQALSRLDRQEALARLNLKLPQDKKLVLIFGGSQGARSINMAVVEALAHFEKSGLPLFILHATGLGGSDHKPWEETQARLAELGGPRWLERFGRLYRAEVYVHDMAAAYSAADLVVCRAGAGAAHEISSMGVPALLIPKPNLPGDHQIQNARAMAAQGAAEVLYEDLLLVDDRLAAGLDGAVLASRVLDLLSQPQTLTRLAQKCQGFMAAQAAERIARLTLGQETAPLKAPAAQISPPPSHEALLTRLSRARAADPEGYDPAQELPEPGELSYYQRRSAFLLADEAWTRRNVGVKLVGLLKDESKVDHLLFMLADRRPVSRLKRWLGGDFVQVGFIRRNCLTSLMIIDRCTPKLEKTLHLALSDPYFEVRSHAAKAVAWFCERLEDRAGFQNRLIHALADPSFEVVREAALALGRAGTDEAAVAALVSLRRHHYWQVRQAALAALRGLVLRGVVKDKNRLRRDVAGFVTTATDFSPHFSIKAAYHQLAAALQKEGE